MYKGLFVTGTDTGAGKTYISCALARAVRKEGFSVGVMKPVSTGDREDARALIKAAGSKDRLDLVNPVFLKYPLAPMVSAAISGVDIDLKLIRKNFNSIKKDRDFTIVEGVGGLMVPLRKDHNVLDMIEDMKLPVVVVAKPVLGTINHTLLTVDKLLQMDLRVAGIVLSCNSNSTLAEKTNPEVLRELTGLPILEVAEGQEINLKQNMWIIGGR